MTFEELIAEFQARGFDYLTTVRCQNYLNSSYMLDIAEAEDWFWLEATSQGKAPLEIKDLRAIEYVTNVTQVTKLDPLLQARITDDWNPDLTEVGTPSFYYVTEGKTVNVFPVSTTDEIAVRYFKVPEELSGAAEPLLPKRFHSLIVDGAVAYTYFDNTFPAAGAARTQNVNLAVLPKQTAPDGSKYVVVSFNISDPNNNVSDFAGNKKLLTFPVELV